MEIVGRFIKQIIGVMKRQIMFPDFKEYENLQSIAKSLHTVSSFHFMFNLYSSCSVTHTFMTSKSELAASHTFAVSYLPHTPSTQEFSVTAERS